MSTLNIDSSQNPAAAKQAQTVENMSPTIRGANDASKAIVNTAATTETNLVNQRDAQKYQRLAGQENRLNNIESTFYQQVDQRRWDLDTIRKRQETVAARNANMAVAQAGQGWVQLSEWEKQSINDDTLAKYGENIITADQARYQWNASLDQAQKGTKLEVYAKRSDINGLLASLDDAGKAALIDAARKARDGDIEAEKQVANSILEYQKKKADEAYTRFAQQEGNTDEEITYQNLSDAMKVSFIADKIRSVWWSDVASKTISDAINQYRNANGWQSPSLTQITDILRYQSNAATFNQDLTKAAASAWTLNPKDSASFKTLTDEAAKSNAGDQKRNTLPIKSGQSTYADQYNKNTKIVWQTVKPTITQIDYVKSILDQWLKNKTLTQREYDRYQLGLNKIQQNGMDGQSYANTYGNPAWLARLGKAK